MSTLDDLRQKKADIEETIWLGKKILRRGAALGRRKLSTNEKIKAMRHLDLISEKIRNCKA